MWHYLIKKNTFPHFIILSYLILFVFIFLLHQDLKAYLYSYKKPYTNLRG